VGNGYRCAACTTRAQIDAARGVDDAVDDLDPATRTRLARRGKLRIACGVGSLGLLISPLVIAALISSSIPLLLAGAFGVYYSSLAIEAIVLGRDQVRRYGTRALPVARVRELRP